MERAPPPTKPLDRATEALVRLNRAMMRTFRREATSEGVSVPQFLLLGWLLRAGTVPSTAFARRIGTSPSTVSGLVDGLVRAGWADRSHATEDRRQVLVRLTPAGRKLIQRLELRRRDRLNRLFRDMEPSAIGRAAILLEGLVDRAEGDERTGDAHRPRAVPRVASPRGRSVGG